MAYAIYDAGHVTAAAQAAAAVKADPRHHERRGWLCRPAGRYLVLAVIGINAAATVALAFICKRHRRDILELRTEQRRQAGSVVLRRF